MIDIITSILSVNGEQQYTVPLFGTVDPDERKIVLHYKMTDEGGVYLWNQEFLTRKINMQVTDVGAQSYCAYGCKFIEQMLAMAGPGIVTVSGYFDRLIRQDQYNKKYDRLLFSFKNIERFFPYVGFETQFTGLSDPLHITLPAQDVKEHSINEQLSCFISSQFHGITSSGQPEIHITQKKIIELDFYDEHTADQLLSILTSVKQYIEFLIAQEIQVSLIRLECKSDPYSSDEVICDDILVPKTQYHEISDKAYGYSEEDFCNGLRGWLANYERLRRVISIWEKTIYNSSVSEEDVFLWRCQSFELLCSLTEEIKDEAYNSLAPDQSNPNLRNYLLVVNAKYNISKRADNYFSDVKDVRDKLTHNNPKKNVTDDQIKNAYSLIKYFLPATMSNIMGFKCRLPGLILMPKQS